VTPDIQFPNPTQTPSIPQKGHFKEAMDYEIASGGNEYLD